MDAKDIMIGEEYRPLVDRIHHYRNISTSIMIEPIFEPNQLLMLENEDSSVRISSHLDLISWQKEISYGFLTKANHIEQAILERASRDDFYIAAILLRHHMEQCGLITLAMEKLMESMKTQSIDVIEDFIAKTLFGSPFNNNKKFKHLPESFMLTKTPNIVALINALDRFIEKNVAGPNNKNVFSKNYSALNHFAHPSSLSSSFFTDAHTVDGGHEILFRFEQDAGGDAAKYNILRMLEQNILVGYSAYFILNSFSFDSDGSISQNEEIIKYGYDNYIEVFKNSSEIISDN